MRRATPTTLLMLKVWRDAVALGSTSLSLIILVLLGTALFVTLGQARINLEQSYKQFYRATHFADATIWVDGAPDSLLETVRLIPGVREVMGRQVKDGTLLLRGRPRRQVTGRFVGIPTTGRSPINDLTVVRGRYATNRNECMLEQLFARENNLHPGDRITGSYRGRKHDFLIVGIAASPEYLYPVPSKEASFVSPQTFGVCWIDEDEARQWLGLGNLVTEIHVLCEPGTAEQALLILRSLGERYGLRTYWTQAEQPSNHLLSLDIQGFAVLSIIFPLLFMLAAALSLYSALTRIVRLQTGIVGFLRASGFSRSQVLWHYIVEAGLVVVAGAVPGLIIGHLLAQALVELYQRELNLPVAITSPQLDIMFAALCIAAIVAGIAAWLPARRAAQTSPAIAMRGVESGGAVPVASWVMAFSGRLSVLARIPARGLLSKPSRTVFAIGGLASGASLLVVSLGMWAAINATLDELFSTIYRYELDVAFVSPAGKTLAEATSSLPGVAAVNHTCTTVVKARSLHAEQSLTLMGVERGQSALFMPKVGGGVAAIDPGDFWLPKATARRLRVEPGDPLYLEWAFSSRQKRVRTVVRVRGLLDINFGGVIYGEYWDVRRRMADLVYPESGYGAQILTSRATGEALQRRFERSELTAAVTNISEIRDQVNESMKITVLFVGVLVIFSSTLAGAVLHSVASVGIIERLRELATLRSLGFSARQTGWIAAVEIYSMATVGLLLGIPLGIWMNAKFLAVYNTETFNFEPALPAWIFLVTIGIVYSLVALSLHNGLVRLRTMDLAQATKAQE